jgi:hypothetical protein
MKENHQTYKIKGNSDENRTYAHSKMNGLKYILIHNSPHVIMGVGNDIQLSDMFDFEATPKHSGTVL